MRGMPPHKKKKQYTARSRWSRYELEKLVYLVSLYGAERVDYEEEARHLFDRSAADVRKRWVAIRDHLRRKLRESILSVMKAAATAPYQGELHPHVQWVETQWDDLGHMKL